MEKIGRAKEATDNSIIRRRKYTIVLPDNKGNNADTHSEYLVVIAFPRQEWLRERTLILRYTYTACFAQFKFCTLLTVRRS